MEFNYVTTGELNKAKKKVTKRMIKNAKSEPRYALTTDQAVEYDEYLKELVDLNYDVDMWYCDKCVKKLTEYNYDVHYDVYDSYDKIKKIRNIFEEGKKLFGDDFVHSLGKILITRSPRDFWKDVGYYVK